MIIFRYIARDILASTAAVSLVLMLVIMSSRFVKYLAQAAGGELDASILFAVIGYRVPGFLELILPLAFFLAILLVYGRMYVDSEMTVLYACGMDPKKLMAYTMVVAIGVAALVAWLSLSVSPQGLAKAEALLSAQKSRGEIESLASGKFYTLRGGRGVTYSEEISEGGHMRNVFLAEPGDKERNNLGHVVILAASGYPQRDEDNGERYLLLEDGYRIQGAPGRADFQITSFEQYGQRMGKPRPGQGRREKAGALTTRKLLSSNEPAHRAALQWRFSVPVLVLVVALMAVPLSRTNSRQGRFVKIFPAVILYILYLVALNAARGAIEEEKQLAALGLWWIHLIFLSIAAVLIAWDSGWRPALPKGSRS
ncbi:MAG: LPS export ABC transporter permease LptF [Gammaproteobacteria bacterium]|nr:MAG: LPS export ABC transporter permease LptF [Gammaproteobacteria bacterium]RLA53464.1 MAG: LPS export ABC transporter permease LptF [Gammaproteobacteria bacterium]